MGGLGMGGKVFGVVLALVLLLFLNAPYWCYAEKWAGVDEAVVEKVAREHSREAVPPLIDPGQGDLLLFAFLAAGTVGGFAAGYYWRKLTEKGGRGKG